MFLLFLSATCFAQKRSEIGVYELIKRFSPYPHKDIKRYELRNLFIKKDNSWVINDNYSKKDSFYLVEDGKKGEKIYGAYKTDTINFFPEKNIYYAPEPKRVLGAQWGKVFYSGDEYETHIFRAAFLTKNKDYKRNIALKKYAPKESDIQVIKDSVFSYIRKLLINNCQHYLEDTSSFFTKQFYGSLSPPLIDTGKIKMDSLSSFIDNKGNKLISFTIPYIYLRYGIYPFNEYCFREGSSYDGLKITCYITKENKLIFLRDELHYLEHGDFDNDGKDEFLFWYSIFNHEGYILYYNDFKNTTEFMWSYH